MPDLGGGYFDQELLDRFRPQLVYDRQYDYRATAAETMVHNPGNLLRGFDDEVIASAGGTPELSLGLLSQYPSGRAPDPRDCLCAAASRIVDARRMEREYGQRVYGRVVKKSDYRWLQYWLWFYDNPKNVRGVGRHEGDWEFVQVAIDAADVPAYLTYSQHKRGEARDAQKGVAFHREGNEVHPVVYVAPLSHACYFEARSHVYVLGIDHPYGDGQAIQPPVNEFGPWADWPGRWGNGEWAVGGQGTGPQSPGRQAQRWKHPDLFHAEASKGGRGLLGRLVHMLGKLTYPRPPKIAVEQTSRGVAVNYQLQGRALHIYLTLHSGEDVIRSRIVDKAPRTGYEEFPMTTLPPDCVLRASTFNRIRQRSDLVEHAIA